MERAVSTARDAGVLVALSLSDPAWVGLHGRPLERLLDRVDILFANEQEACGLSRCDEAEAAATALAQPGRTVVVTRGALGSIVASESDLVAVPAAQVTNVVDTTGAGDSFAAGFLFGVTRGRSAGDCARLGALAAAEIVSHLGARPLQSLAARADAAGLLD